MARRRASIVVPITAGFFGGAFVARGGFASGSSGLEQAQIGILGAGSQAEIRSGENAVDAILFAAKPRSEPAMQFRSALLNTADQMAEAVDPIAAGTFPN